MPLSENLRISAASSSISHCDRARSNLHHSTHPRKGEPVTGCCLSCTGTTYTRVSLRGRDSNPVTSMNSRRRAIHPGITTTIPHHASDTCHTNLGRFSWQTPHQPCYLQRLEASATGHSTATSLCARLVGERSSSRSDQRLLCNSREHHRPADAGRPPPRWWGVNRGGAPRSELAQARARPLGRAPPLPTAQSWQEGRRNHGG